MDNKQQRKEIKTIACTPDSFHEIAAASNIPKN